jgi:CubicO group peptidase (beta-lactamase class C family)
MGAASAHPRAPLSKAMSILTSSAPVIERADPDRLGFCPERLARLPRLLAERAASGHIPGAVVAVGRAGQVACLDAVGSQAPGGPAMQVDSVFRIYSMTKPLVSVAAMQLVEQGRMLLTDPLPRWLPEYADTGVAAVEAGRLNSRRPGRPPTLQDLLRHTAGFTYEFLGDGPVQRAYAAVSVGSRGRDNAAFSRELARIPYAFEPGSVWAYSRATDVLGRVVEVVSGQTLGVYLAEHVLGPLGMTETGFAARDEQRARLAQPFPHDPDGGVPLAVFDPLEAPLMESGGGGLVSTAPDYLRFLQCLLARGRLPDGGWLLSPRTLALMTSDHLGRRIPAQGDLLPPGHGFGLGFAVRTSAGEASTPGSVGMYYWSGIAGTAFFCDPAEDLWAMILTQAPNQRDHYRLLLRNMVYAALVS